MRWRINQKNSLCVAAVIGIAAAVFSCGSNPEETGAPAAIQTEHIDLPEFFRQEIDSLKTLDPLVKKNVRKDKLAEEKQLRIKNWDAELASFRAIDLNKPAYEGIMLIDTLDDKTLQYHFNDPKADLSCVRIRFDMAGNPEMVAVERTVESSLYTTKEFLAYEKGNFYLVEKDQKVLLLGNNFYRVEGQFSE